MAEQLVPLKRRASAKRSASQNYAGHSAGIHPEDDPYWTDAQETEPDSYYQTRAPLSTRRYQYTDRNGNQIIQQGNQRLVIHDEPPPKKKKHHALLYVGIGMAIMVLGWIGLQLLGIWWTNYQLNSTYEFPRIYQTDAIVYPGDTADHPSHYIFLNLHGNVQIIEEPQGDTAHARIYKGPQLLSDNADAIPVTGEIKVVGNKIEMLVHVDDQTIRYVNDGKEFKEQ